jgi:hypothetical protein
VGVNTGLQIEAEKDRSSKANNHLLLVEQSRSERNDVEPTQEKG